MYTLITFANNDYLPNEKKVNPVNLSIRPADIANLTAEGRATCQAALLGSLHYPNINDDVLPFEMHRGVDLNDAWEASQEANDKVREVVEAMAEKSNIQTNE